MIQAGGRRLNPLQPSLLDDAVPIDGHFRMATKQVAVEQFFGDVFLPGVADFRIRRSGLNFSNVPRFDGIAEDDTHGNFRILD